MIPIYDYKKKNADQLNAFVKHVIDHGFGILQLFDEKTVKRIEKHCDRDLENACGSIYENIINGTEEERNSSLRCIGGIRKKVQHLKYFIQNPFLTFILVKQCNIFLIHYMIVLLKRIIRFINLHLK